MRTIRIFGHNQQFYVQLNVSDEAMQITAELDCQHLDKLHTLEKTLKKTTSELIAFLLMKYSLKTQSIPKGIMPINSCSNPGLLVLWRMMAIFRETIFII
jgi:hypothetical protein